MKVNATIQVNGRPLRRAYVEHLVWGVGTGMYITDLDGRIQDNNSEPGVESATANADIRIICQNPVARVLDGNLANIGVYQDKSIDDGDTVNLNTNAEQDDYYAILNRLHLAYEVVFRHLSFFRNLSDRNFPLGRKSTLRETRDQGKRIDVIYPDYSLATLAWVEPKRLLDNFPLMHFKVRTDDGRLLGDDGERPTLIPHELAHALHFSFLTEEQRGRAQDRYLDFILAGLFTGVWATHSFELQTTPEVAYIEAVGIFSERFHDFIRVRQDLDSTLINPDPITTAIRDEFLEAEWMNVTTTSFPRLGRLFRLVAGIGLSLSPRARRFLVQITRIFRRPEVVGGDVEGAVYSAIFVDFASAVGLDFAASSYFEANAVTIDEYQQFIDDQHPEHSTALDRALSFWGIGE
jgi:hypothetical protein